MIIKKNSSPRFSASFTGILPRVFFENRLPFFSTLILGLAAHMFALTNKIPFDDDLPFLFDKGASTVSGRYGLEVMRFIMPDYSMPWIYGIMSLIILALASCLIVRIFNIRNKIFQVLLGGLLISFPSETGTMSYMFTAAPYALALLMVVFSVFVFSKNFKSKWVISPLLLAFSCSIYQGYFSFAASFCVLLMIQTLITEEKSAVETLKFGVQLLSMLLLSLAVYGLAILFFSKLFCNCKRT